MLKRSIPLLVLGAICAWVAPASAQSPCSNEPVRASFETPTYQLSVCQGSNALFLISQQKSGQQPLLKMPAFYNPDSRVFGAVRTIPNPGAAYAYDLDPAIITVYYIQNGRLYVLENGRLVTNERITRSDNNR